MKAIIETHQSEKTLIQNFLDNCDAMTATKRTYDNGLKRFFEYMRGKQEITRADLLAYKADLIATCKPSTVNCYLASVKSFYEWLESAGISPNLAKGIKGVRENAGFKKNELSLNQARRLLDSISRDRIEGKRDFALINLLIRCGLRTIEAARANIGDISASEDQPALLYVEGKGHSEKDDFVMLTDGALEPIRDYLTARGDTDPDAPLFASHGNRNAGGRLQVESISRIIKTRMREAGIDDSKITAHSLRHTCATNAIKAGANVRQVQKMMRHAKIETTLLYCHDLDRKANAAEFAASDYLDNAL